MTEIALGKFDRYGGRGDMMLGSVMPDTQFLMPNARKLIKHKTFAL